MRTCPEDGEEQMPMSIRTLSGPLRVLTFFLAFNITAVWALASLTAPRGSPSNLSTTRRTFTLDTGGDSWNAMGKAIAYLRSDKNSGNVYTEMLQVRVLKFQYPLSSLIPFEGLRVIARYFGLDFRRFMAVIGWLWMIGLIACCTALLDRLAPKREQIIIQIGLVTLAALTFYPLTRGYTLGQIQIWINTLFAGALLAWAASRKVLAGVLIGLASLLKPHYAFFVLWAAVRREWGFTIACLLTGLLGLGVALAIFGVSNNLDYLNALSLFSERGESYHANQSVNGILNRIIGLWDPALYNNLVGSDVFPPYTPLVYYGTFVTSATLLFMVLAMRHSDTVIDFCIGGLGLTMASPIAWEHHYGILLPIYVVAFARLFDSRSALLLLAFSYALTSNLWSGTNFLATTAFNFMQAYVFMGALLLLLLLVLTTEADHSVTRIEKTGGDDNPMMGRIA